MCVCVCVYIYWHCRSLCQVKTKNKTKTNFQIPNFSSDPPIHNKQSQRYLPFSQFLLLLLLFWLHRTVLLIIFEDNFSFSNSSIIMNCKTTRLNWFFSWHNYILFSPFFISFCTKYKLSHTFPFLCL